MPILFFYFKLYHMIYINFSLIFITNYIQQIIPSFRIISKRTQEHIHIT